MTASTLVQIELYEAHSRTRPVSVSGEVLLPARLCDTVQPTSAYAKAVAAKAAAAVLAKGPVSSFSVLTRDSDVPGSSTDSMAAQVLADETAPSVRKSYADYVTEAKALKARLTDR